LAALVVKELRRMITTTAWVLHKAPERGHEALIERLHEETYVLGDLAEGEVLVEPLYGCWEGNMSHAVQRDPIDICDQRHEDRVVIGNAGVVRVLRPGAAVRELKEGDLCLVYCNGVPDARGYPEKIYAYDAPGTVGLLARRTKLDQRQLIPVPEGGGYSLRQWAAFSLRYITAWANWQVADGCWRLLAAVDGPAEVWGWGGGVTFAQLTLASLMGARATMISGQRCRLELMAAHGVQGLDRGAFPDLAFDPERYAIDPAFKDRYLDSEQRFLRLVEERTAGRGVAIFVDFIGLPVYRATLKALARPGVITTAGWKEGMVLTTLRAVECIRWHAHVHTHYARRDQALAAIAFAEEKSWMPPQEDALYRWEEIPALAEAHCAGRIGSLFPLFEVNPS
jgi:NADPH:quinone reductase-like Zn-dependent oxidoreductase